MNKPISKKEQQARTAEANVKRNKKRDFRKLANQLFKNPTDNLPLKMCGLGSGKNAYCYDCKIIPPKVVIIGNVITCKTCGGNNVELRDRRASFLKKLYWKFKEFFYERCNKK